MSNETYKSPAEESANKILQGVRVIQKNNPKVSLIGLDKGVFVGPLSTADEGLTDDEVNQLEQLGWSWNQEQESWEFYTGHG